MRRIVLTGVPPFEVQDLAGPLEVFAQCDYEIELVSPERDGSTAINRGLRVTGGTDFRKFDRPIDTLWVVGGPEAPSGRYDPAYLRWLKEMSSQARRVGASCLGTFVLAGSHTGVHFVQPGDRLRCDFEGVGHVEFKLHEAAPTIQGASDAGR